MSPPDCNNTTITFSYVGVEIVFETSVYRGSDVSLKLFTALLGEEIPNSASAIVLLVAVQEK